MDLNVKIGMSLDEFFLENQRESVFRVDCTAAACVAAYFNGRELIHDASNQKCLLLVGGAITQPQSGRMHF
jgi:hypothetical protein